jgi:DNA-binding IclR family transcriptional regulator
MGRRKDSILELEPSSIKSSASARALAILEAVSRSNSPISSVELATVLDFSKATVHRLLLLLEEIGFVQREPNSRRFIPGHRLTRMAIGSLMNAPRKAERQAILRQVVDETRETANIATLAGDQVVYLERVECNWPLRTRLEPGSRVPIHCGGSGKLFLSLMPAAQRRKLVRSINLTRYTRNTIVDRAAFEAELKQTRLTKIGLDDEEMMEGLIGLAVPVFDGNGRMVATVAIHATTLRTNKQDVMQFIPALRRAALAIAETLG